MPELPEVETIRQDLNRKITGARIVSVGINDTMVVRFPSPKIFISRLTDKTITDVDRRGKALIIVLGHGDFLVIQLMMTGQLIYGKKIDSSRVNFKLSNGCYLNYNDQRRFGRLTVIRRLDELKFISSLGREPLSQEFTCDWLTSELKKRQAPIKSLLMNQNIIAGIGNIYASEILYRAKIHPHRPACSLKALEIQILHEKIIAVLKEAIKFRGSSINNYRDSNGEKGHFVNRIKVYGKEGEKCVICKALIHRIVIAGRSTFFCNRCQS